jgi:hypothetical protein
MIPGIIGALQWKCWLTVPTQPRRIRMAELVDDAAKDGLTIDLWYDDMGLSGRGEFLEKREGFERARQDANAGRVGVLYARDLSRLFRDLVQQELWFAEMGKAGCAVRIQDLPFIADDATRVLIRQQIGSINQYLATRSGALIKTILRERVKSGLWVGREQSFWGLAYNPDTHGFDFDPTTAEKIRTVFDVWIACKGVGGRTATTLNQMLDDGHPDATAAFQGGRWTRASVFGHIRNPLYRRETTYADVRVSQPHLIPEVVDPEIVAEANRLDALRSPGNAAFAEKTKAGRLDHTYSGMLRCGYCGSRLTTRRPYDKKMGDKASDDKAPDDKPPSPPRWIAWWCAGSSKSNSHASAAPRCPDSFLVQQSRIDALVGQVLVDALADYEMVHFHSRKKSQSGRGKSKQPVSDKDSLAKALREIDERRDRCYELWENGVIKDASVLQSRLERIAEDRRRVEALSVSPSEEPSPVSPVLSQAQFRALQAQMPRVWVSDSTRHAGDALDLEKYDLLASLGVRVSVRVLPRNPDKQEQRRQAGRLEITMEIAALGSAGDTAITRQETEEALRAHNLWRIRNAHRRQREMIEAGEWEQDWKRNQPRNNPEEAAKKRNHDFQG